MENSLQRSTVAPAGSWCTTSSVDSTRLNAPAGVLLLLGGFCRNAAGRHSPAAEARAIFTTVNSGLVTTKRLCYFIKIVNNAVIG